MNDPDSKDTPGPFDCRPKCVVFSRTARNLQPLLQRGWIPLGAGDGLPQTVAWSDDYINILSPLIAKLKGR